MKEEWEKYANSLKVKKDRDLLRNPQQAIVAAQGIVENLIKVEPLMITDQEKVHQTQTYVKEANRATMVGWLIQTHGSYKLFHETLFVAQMITDKYLE
jgi:hypothetical protein